MIVHIISESHSLPSPSPSTNLHPLTPENSSIQEGPGDVAGALGLTGGDSNERLLLFQLPQLLPAPLSARATSVKLEAGRQQRGGKDDHADRETPPPDQALSMDQLPAGRVRILVNYQPVNRPLGSAVTCSCACVLQFNRFKVQNQSLKSESLSLNRRGDDCKV